MWLQNLLYWHAVKYGTIKKLSENGLEKKFLVGFILYSMLVTILLSFKQVLNIFVLCRFVTFFHLKILVYFKPHKGIGILSWEACYPQGYQAWKFVAEPWGMLSLLLPLFMFLLPMLIMCIFLHLTSTYGNTTRWNSVTCTILSIQYFAVHFNHLLFRLLTDVFEKFTVLPTIFALSFFFLPSSAPHSKEMKTNEANLHWECCLLKIYDENHLATNWNHLFFSFRGNLYN